ncbi:hypothetical protein AHF37_06569 [Paragonimus kellicotti]|nr:hypothetical protein AHF37_06569 [Paragonimus kellicotti]
MYVLCTKDVIRMEVNASQAKLNSNVPANSQYSIPPGNTQGITDLNSVYSGTVNREKPHTELQLTHSKVVNDQRFNVGGVYIDQNVCAFSSSNNMEFYSNETAGQPVSEGAFEPLISLSCASSSQQGSSVDLVADSNAFPTTFPVSKDGQHDRPEPKDIVTLKPQSVSHTKPSETLFVRALIGRCKRIAPLWFRGVSSMRERNREENRRTENSSGQTQSDWSLIGRKIAEQNGDVEYDSDSRRLSRWKLRRIYKTLGGLH